MTTMMKERALEGGLNNKSKLKLTRAQKLEIEAGRYLDIRLEIQRLEWDLEVCRTNILTNLGRRRSFRSKFFSILRVRQVQNHLDPEKLEKVLGDLKKYKKAIPIEQLRVTKTG